MTKDEREELGKKGSDEIVDFLTQHIMAEIYDDFFPLRMNTSQLLISNRSFHKEIQEKITEIWPEK